MVPASSRQHRILASPMPAAAMADGIEIPSAQRTSASSPSKIPHLKVRALSARPGRAVRSGCPPAHTPDFLSWGFKDRPSVDISTLRPVPSCCKQLLFGEGAASPSRIFRPCRSNRLRRLAPQCTWQVDSSRLAPSGLVACHRPWGSRRFHTCASAHRSTPSRTRVRLAWCVPTASIACASPTVPCPSKCSPRQQPLRCHHRPLPSRR
jgi:hypothetical protein